MERLIGWYRVGSSVAAVVALVAFNLVPLAGVLWWGWNLLSILALYWVENGIVGVFNVVKILRAEGTSLRGSWQVRFNDRPIETVARGPIAAFFLLHYGIFWLTHGLFVLVFLPLMAGFGPLMPGSVPCFDAAACSVGGPEWGLVGAGAVGLALSHGVSFWTNYIGRREYQTTSPGQLMLAPYGRLVILHLTIIFGGMVSLWLGSPVGSLLVLVALKTMLDLAFHLREHRGMPTFAAGSPDPAAGNPSQTVS